MNINKFCACVREHHKQGMVLAVVSNGHKPTIHSCAESLLVEAGSRQVKKKKTNLISILRQYMAEARNKGAFICWVEGAGASCAHRERHKKLVEACQ